MTRWPGGAAIAAILLAGCGGPEEPPGLRYTQVIWKEDTAVQRRATDQRVCELAAIGLTPSATQTEIEAATLATSAQDHDRTLRSCLATRGYAIVEFPVCSEADMPAGTARRILATDDLPPIDRVRCITRDRGSFVPL